MAKKKKIETTTTEDIALKNDALRQTLRGKVVYTKELCESGFFHAAVAAVRTFHRFTTPERDRGSFMVLDRKCWFKIENETLTIGMGDL